MKHLTIALAAIFLVACDAPEPITRAQAPELLVTTATAPPGAAPGACWGKTVEPAVMETVTEDVLVQPAQVSSTGVVQAPPIYRKETRERIAIPRLESWFQTPCAEDLTPAFIATIQRALAARGMYSGPANGLMDARTRAAVRKFQAPQGLDSGILSVAAAQQMGLWTVPRETLIEDS